MTEAGLRIPSLPGVVQADCERGVYWLHVTLEEEELTWQFTVYLTGWLTHKKKNQRHLFFNCLIFSHGQRQNVHPWVFVSKKKKMQQAYFRPSNERRRRNSHRLCHFKMFSWEEANLYRRMAHKEKTKPFVYFEFYLSFLIYAISKDWFRNRVSAESGNAVA